MKQDILFQYNLPVLIIAITWHEKQAQFGTFLHLQLHLNYFNNEDYVRIFLICGEYQEY